MEREREDGRKDALGDALSMARAYQAMGWRVVPLRRDGKTPIEKDWPTHGPLSEGGLLHNFGGTRPANVGLVLGEAGGSLVDVDCDWPEAAVAAAHLLPPTGRVSGRASSPGSHRWYVIEGALPQHETWEWGKKGEGRAMVVELRAGGHQTMAPPSRHPSGERVVWHVAGQPGRVTADELRAKVAEVAAAALLARHWPAQGTRDQAAMALAGMLLRWKWDDARVDAFTEAVAHAAGDEEWRRRGQGVATAAKLERKEHVTGATTLEGLLTDGGVAVVAQVRTWLALARDERAPYSPDSPPSCDMTNVANVANVGKDPQHWEILSVRASEVEERPLHWLWRGRIPLGAITMLDGDPGLGKSLLTLDLAARVTTGRAMPDGTPGVEGGVVLLSAEDDPSVTIRPRLAAAGADLTRISIVRGVRGVRSTEPEPPKEPKPPKTAKATEETEARPIIERGFAIPGDCTPLAREIAEVGAILVVIDPLMAYLDPTLNSWRDQDMRTALTPLSRLAEESGAAIIILRHLTKGGGANAVYRGGGSIGIIGAARAGLLVAKDPDNPEIERVVATAKSNLGPPMPSLRYRLDAPEDEGATDTLAVPTVVWLGASEQTASSLLTIGSEDATAVAQAATYLRAALANGPRPLRELISEAKVAGISPRTLDRARPVVGAVPDKDGKRGKTLFLPPARPADPPHSPHSPHSPHARDHTSVASLASLTGLVDRPPTDPCPATPDGAHVYAAMRDAHSHRVCIECQHVEQEAER